MSQDFNSALRVALVTGGLKLGGSTTFLCNLGGELVRRRIPIEVLSFENDNPLAADFQKLNIPVLCLDDRRLPYEDRMQKILERLNRFKPTVALATLSGTSFETLRYLPAGVFRIGVGQSDDPEIYPGIARYAACLDAVAVVSKTMKQKMEAQPELAPRPIHYLPYGVPIPEMSREQNGDAQAPLRILYLGRLEREQKRVHLFPQILEELKLSGIPFHWTMAGDGSEKEALEKKMKSTSPSQTISFVGKISYTQVPEILRTHDIYLLASDYEGLPLSLLEAMGHGLVPVVSDLPSGIPEMVDENTGSLVAPKNVTGYAEAIIWLHGHREELNRLSANARARVKKEFSVQAMTDRWLSIFPSNFPAIDEWPTSWKIQPPLSARHPIYFSPPLRAVRRLAMKFRRWVFARELSSLM